MLYGMVERTWGLLQIPLLLLQASVSSFTKLGVIIPILSDSGKDLLSANHSFLTQRHVKMAAVIGCIIRHI